MTGQIPEPGDLCVVNTLNPASSAVQLMEWLSGKKFSQWNHVCTCTRIEARPPGMYRDGMGSQQIWVAEAEASGAVEVPWHYGNVPHQWSTGVLPTSQAVADAAIRYTQPGPWGPNGVPYSWLDYAAIAAHRWHVPALGLRSYIESTMHMMCSQMADRCKSDGGVQLFDDGRWEGYVAPDDLGALLPAGQWSSSWTWTGRRWNTTPAERRRY